MPRKVSKVKKIHKYEQEEGKNGFPDPIKTSCFHVVGIFELGGCEC